MGRPFPRRTPHTLRFFPFQPVYLRYVWQICSGLSIKQMSGSFTWHLSKILFSAAPHSKNSARKYRLLFAAASIKCLQKSIQYVAASNTSESKVKVVTNTFGGIAEQCNRIKTWFD
ncbi:hypothetical protein [Bifidobacterium catenulatum]|uniref:hypothetical protein n=1 Tax=Bifidobacterium catenulatum TaxID=1686 RepID=UPI0025519211|nr:hypothetical protein [Bifidobacterium catenulatum]WJD54294.1 hypothetical protein QR502_02090 [Bifidobacterium catenulatum]WJO86995.1 hypothetical protein K1T30_007055 [Bifidobacterium catenulatum]